MTNQEHLLKMGAIISPLEQRAQAFATGAHAAIDQRRKYTNEPYIVHPAAVVEIVRSVCDIPVVLAAAWLHDTVEDTKVTIDVIEEVFGQQVALLVLELTDKSRPEDGNRVARKAIDRQHLALASPSAQTIKLADLIDNTSSIVQYDREFAQTYLLEKGLLLEVLTRGDEVLQAMARASLVKANAFLGRVE